PAYCGLHTCAHGPPLVGGFPVSRPYRAAGGLRGGKRERRVAGDCVEIGVEMKDLSAGADGDCRFTRVGQPANRRSLAPAGAVSAVRRPYPPRIWSRSPSQPVPLIASASSRL